ncbi:hypothetical protein [Rhodococcus olei]|uniref:hypothetical protein n=1 Tax=Rhodococcus olei TaxID=2161675 RepID=UPI0031F0EFEF
MFAQRLTVPDLESGSFQGRRHPAVDQHPDRLVVARCDQGRAVACVDQLAAPGDLRGVLRLEE